VLLTNLAGEVPATLIVIKNEIFPQSLRRAIFLIDINVLFPNWPEKGLVRLVPLPASA
jgi:hypothetical protein